MVKMGAQPGLSCMSRKLKHLENVFPGLRQKTKTGKRKYMKTSDHADSYNCIAWAAGFPSRNWHDQADGYWPKDAKRKGPHIKDLVSLFESLGYELCDGYLPEDGYEKVALYHADDDEWQHAARRLRHVKWARKLGKVER